MPLIAARKRTSPEVRVGPEPAIECAKIRCRLDGRPEGLHSRWQGPTTACHQDHCQHNCGGAPRTASPIESATNCHQRQLCGPSCNPEKALAAACSRLRVGRIADNAWPACLAYRTRDVAACAGSGWPPRSSPGKQTGYKAASCRPRDRSASDEGRRSRGAIPGFAQDTCSTWIGWLRGLGACRGHSRRTSLRSERERQSKPPCPTDCPAR
jgi:hypothetical protein